MPATSDLISFVVAVLALFFIPGPAVFLTLAQSVHGGRRAGIATAIGISLGDLVHVMMAILGLTALLAASATAFRAIKFVGAAYLLYLAVRSWRSPSALQTPDEPPLDPHHAFRQGLLTEVLNPKTALFFLAFLPQFVRQQNGPALPQLIVLGAVFVVMSFTYTTLLSLAAGWIRPWFTGTHAFARWQGKAIAGIYFSLGVRLALQEQE